MELTRLDRENRGKVNSVTGVPGPGVKGNICLDNATGWIYTRKTPVASWDLAADGPGLWTRYIDSFHPSLAPVSDSYSIIDFTGQVKALEWGVAIAAFGNGTISYVGTGDELKARLQDSESGIIVLGNQIYDIETGTVTISAPKTIIGSARGESVIRFQDDTTADYLHIDNTEDVIFKDLTITKIVNAGAPVSFLIDVEDSPRCRFENCTFGDSLSTLGDTSNGMIGFDDSDNCVVEHCKFVMNVQELSPPALILANSSSHLVLRDNWGIDLRSGGSFWLYDCTNATITGNKFASHSTEPGSVIMLLHDDCSGAYIENNVLVNINLGATLATALVFGCIASGGPPYLLDGLRVTNNTFVLNQSGDDVGTGDPVIGLVGKNINFTNNNIYANYHGYDDDYVTDPVPTNVVLHAFGDRILISDNSFDVEKCRCAINLDSTGVDGIEPAYGNRIIGNTISDFSIASPGATPLGLRIDATGIYLGNISGVTLHQGTVIANNILWNGTSGTAIRGCPVNCAPLSLIYPPAPGETAESLSIVGNLMRSDGVKYFGISIATISFSSIVANTSVTPGITVIDNSELAGNNTNEYGTTGAVEPGVNL